MTDESSDAIKIRRAPNGKYYVWENGEVICVMEACAISRRSVTLGRF